MSVEHDLSIGRARGDCSEQILLLCGGLLLKVKGERRDEGLA